MTARAEAKLMKRFDLTKRLVAKLTREEAVVAGIGNTHFDLWATGQRPQNFYMLGSMGLACPIALGVAIAQPQRKVFAIEGDGSMLMQLGSLGTIAAVAPNNLAVVIMDNASYQITGGQKTLTAHHTDVVAMARGAGLAKSDWAADEDDFERRIDRALAEDGPWLIGARIDNTPPQAETERDPMRIREGFMRGIGARK